jgi:urocanate hydratase
LIVIQDVRKRDQYNYETQVTELNALKTLFEECLVFIEEIFQGENTFAQLARHTNKIMKKAVATRQINGMGALLQVMVQMASSSDLAVDEQLFQRVKELIKNQLTKTTDKIQEVVAAEQTAVETFNAEETRVKGIIAQLETAIQALEVEITQLDKCIVTQIGIVNSAQAKLDRNSKLKEDASNLCQACEDEYKSSSNSRKQELQLLAAIKDRVEVRFAALSSGVTERGKADSFNYNAENDYEKKQFVASTA